MKYTFNHLFKAVAISTPRPFKAYQHLKYQKQADMWACTAAEHEPQCHTHTHTHARTHTHTHAHTFPGPAAPIHSEFQAKGKVIFWTCMKPFVRLLSVTSVKLDLACRGSAASDYQKNTDNRPTAKCIQHRPKGADLYWYHVRRSLFQRFAGHCVLWVWRRNTLMIHM